MYPFVSLVAYVKNCDFPLSNQLVTSLITGLPSRKKHKSFFFSQHNVVQPDEIFIFSYVFL